MKRHITKSFIVLASLVLIVAFVFTIIELTGAQQIPGLPSLPGGIKVPSLSGLASGKTGFGGVDAVTTAKQLYGQKDKPAYPTPNIAVSGNHIVIAWPNGVVTVETIADDGTLHRVVLGPPSENNIP